MYIYSENYPGPCMTLIRLRDHFYKCTIYAKPKIVHNMYNNGSTPFFIINSLNDDLYDFT